jgi:hypothetical protein
MDIIKEHNISHLTLLRNKGFTLITQMGHKVFIKVPTFEDYIADNSLLTFLSLLDINRSQFVGLDVETNYQLLLTLIQNNIYTEDITFTLHKYIPDIAIKNEGFFIGKNRLIPPELDFIILT